MKLKVCGLKVEENIREVVALTPDFIGFIFYAPSPRYAGELNPEVIRGIAGSTKVGVFVNASINEIQQTSEEFGLQMIQLHGEESIELIKELKSLGFKLIKVFRVANSLPENLKEFAPYCDYFLFDTQTKNYGGSGKQFDWSLLRNVSHPYLLSGGIGSEDIEKIKELQLPNLIGIDINSKVETAPGLKSIEQIKILKSKL